ncbi:MAG: hypothetical protein JWM85_1096 [Acidimicrobiaceae bacterium]|nr:hypothetical protein [Acidimicrobiaceae bacterium]
MTALQLSVVDVAVDRYAASPHLLAKVRIDESSGAAIHAMALRCQLMIEPQRRSYDDGEVATLAELFGGRERWAQTLKPFLWTYASTVTRSFSGSHTVDLPIACTYDVEVVGSKFLHALSSGEVPLRFLFSGTVFSRADPGISVEQISWDLEDSYRMPVSVWDELVRTFYPGSGYLRLDHDTIDALLEFKAARGLTSFESVVDALLADASTPETVG